MGYFQVEGGRRLEGTLSVQGAKNAVLPALSAALLHEGTTVFTHVPDISDVRDTLELLRLTGCEVRQEGGTVTIAADRVTEGCMPRDMVGKMRSSFLLAGAMLGRIGWIDTFCPGGCIIGARPVDLHLKGFAGMGTEMLLESDRIYLQAPHLHGARIRLPFPSVGATENLVLAAVRAEGVTEIKGAAKEPEVVNLCRCLNHMGADIQILDDRIEVTGVKALRDVTWEIPGDRIVAGTFLAAVGACGGSLRMENVNTAELGAVLSSARLAGLSVKEEPDALEVCQDGRLSGGLELVTGPYPEFPTDLQALFMAMLTQAKQGSVIQETVFEHRFQHVDELRKLGADIKVYGNTAQIAGNSRLQGGLVRAHDLRAGAALIVAGLASDGVTVIEQADYVLRGYENLPELLNMLGAKAHLIP